jgi:MoaA/NifB/PqqE/SkfB family radical SAM enzyme
VGILHDHDGQLQPLGDRQREIYERIMTMGKRSYARFNQFQKNISRGLASDWRCRAGSRYLYICEDGLVHYCSQQRGFPAIPLEKYTCDHLAHEYQTQKKCAPHCTVSCVQQVAMLDNWRSPQTRPAFVPVESLLPFPNNLSEG